MSLSQEDLLDRALADLDRGAGAEEVLRRYPELAPLLRLAVRLGAEGTLRAPPDFRLTARDRLLRRIGGRPIDLHRRRPAPAALLRPAAMLALLVVLLVAPYRASAHALPGDPLYRVKRTGEAVRLALVGDEAESARLRLVLAQRRLAEAGALARTGRRPQAQDHVTEELRRLIDDLLEAVQQGSVTLSREDLRGLLELCRGILAGPGATSAPQGSLRRGCQQAAQLFDMAAAAPAGSP